MLPVEKSSVSSRRIERLPCIKEGQTSSVLDIQPGQTYSVVHRNDGTARLDGFFQGKHVPCPWDHVRACRSLEAQRDDTGTKQEVCDHEKEGQTRDVPESSVLFHVHCVHGVSPVLVSTTRWQIQRGDTLYGQRSFKVKTLYFQRIITG